MSWKLLAFTGLWCALALPALAAPTITFTNEFTAGNVAQWNLFVTPDVATFVPNTSLAVELDLAFSRSINNYTINTAFWNVSPINNVGNNPFTGTVTPTVLDTTPGHNTLFIAAGSALYATATPALLATIYTRGANGIFNIGGHTVLSGADQYSTARISQNGVNYDGITVVSEPFPKCGPPGDFNCNGRVEGGDLTLLLNSWGKPTDPPPPIWIGDPPPTGPRIDADELTALLNHWAQHTPGAGSGSTSAVPEPTSATLMVLALLALVGCSRRRS